jgi:hypothetical protein
MCVFANQPLINFIPRRFPTLTADDAFDLACHDARVQSDILPFDFQRTFAKSDLYEATLDFEQVRSNMTEEQRRLEKERLKEEKLRKKQRREEKIAERQKAADKKEAMAAAQRDVPGQK